MKHLCRVLEWVDKKIYKKIIGLIEEKLFGCLAISIVLLSYIFDKNQDLYQIIRNIILFYGLKVMVYLDTSKKEKCIAINCQNSNVEIDNFEQEETLELENRAPIEATEVHCVPTSRIYPHSYNCPFTNHSSVGPQVMSVEQFISMFPHTRFPSTNRHVENSVGNRPYRTSSQTPNNRSHNNRNYRYSNYRTSRNNTNRLSANTQPFIPNNH